MLRRLGCLGLLLLTWSAAHAASPPAPDLQDELARRCVRFFVEQRHPETGLIANLAPADGSAMGEVCSIASIGFGLPAYCIAAERGWIPRDEALALCLGTLKTVLTRLEHHHGFLFHFVDMATGARRWDSEVSSIDTALLVAGALTAGRYFPGTEVETLAAELYRRVEWPWMLNGGATLSMGWFPESGFIASRWDVYSEHMLMDLLAMAAPEHPVSPDLWHAWARRPIGTYAGRTFLQCPPLFTHQYSQAWVDFRGQRDAYADYWHNSTLATLAQRQLCIDMAWSYPAYGPDMWGLTSSDGPEGYSAWGGPPYTSYCPGHGVVVPCAPGGSLPFAPQECGRALQAMHDRFGEQIWKRYGFVDAFNPGTGWTSPVVIGIDVGITLLMLENARSGKVWEWFMQTTGIQEAIGTAGFVSTARDLTQEDRAYLEVLAADTWRCLEGLVQPETGVPRDRSGHSEETSVSNLGLYLTDLVGAAELGLLTWEGAAKRAVHSLESIEKLKTCFGFQQSWNHVTTLQPSSNDTWISILDSGNLAAGLLTAGEAFPDLRERCRALVAAMEWGHFYDPKRDIMQGGYDVANKRDNPGWTLPFLGTDSRLACFFAVASGGAPVSMWEKQDRGMESRCHTQYLKPGWQGGGLFMQFINGLWLDERATLMGRSAQNFAYAQIQHARQKGYPAWGWSASDSPAGGYLGWGKIQDDVVTPHACVLALEHFPQAVLANLRVLESLGVRSEHEGFFDAVDIKTGRRSETYLLLDQSMLFLSLVNFLCDDAIRARFQRDPLVRRGRELLADFRSPSYGTNVSIYVLAEDPVNIRAFEPPAKDPPRARVRRVGAAGESDWIRLSVSNGLESISVPESERELAARIGFRWNEEVLVFEATVSDRAASNAFESVDLHCGDCVELFVDPQGDGLQWASSQDFQFGFALPNKSWEWFGGRLLDHAEVVPTADGYRVQARIPWTLLGIEPKPGLVLSCSPAVKSVGAESVREVKLNWCWLQGSPGVRLGQLVLE